MEDTQLTQLLLKESKVSDGDLSRAVEMQATIGGELGHILVKMGYLTDEELMSLTARLEGLDFEDLSDLVIPENLVTTFPRELIEKHQVLPISKHGDTILVAVSNSLDLEAIDEIQFLTSLRVRMVLASRDQLRKAINRFYQDLENLERAERERASSGGRGTPPPHSPSRGEGALSSPQPAIMLVDETSSVAGEEVPDYKLKAALIPLLVSKGIITRSELMAQAKLLDRAGQAH